MENSPLVWNYCINVSISITTHINATCSTQTQVRNNIYLCTNSRTRQKDKFLYVFGRMYACCTFIFCF